MVEVVAYTERAGGSRAGRLGTQAVFTERGSSPGQRGPELEARPVESVRGQRRPPRGGRFVLAPSKVVEDAGNEGGLGDGGDDVDVAPALGTSVQLDAPYTLEADHPAHRGAMGTGGSLVAIARGSLGVGAGDDELAMSRPRRE